MSAYDNLGGGKAAFVDGALKEPRTTNQPRILVIGPAEKGLTGEIYPVTNSSAAEKEFGAATPVMRGVHEVLAQGANHVAIMRVGGSPGSIVFTDNSANTLTITPSSNDDLILARYALIVSNDGSDNRYLVYDLVDEVFVYDTSEIEAIDSGTVEVIGVDDIVDLWQVGDRTDPTAAISMATIVTGDFDTTGSNVAPASIASVAGSDGMTPALVERYAALNSGYFNLDYADADFLLPVDVFIDDANIADDASPATYGYFGFGVPEAGSARDKLGYLWQYVYQRQIFTYMTDTATYFSVAKVAATITVETDLVLTASIAGVGGNANTIFVDVGGAAGPTVTVTENVNGGLAISVEDDGTSTTSATVTAINLALGLFTHSTGALGSSLVVASGGAVTLLSGTAITNFATGAGGHVLTHEDLTGEAIPAAVAARFAAGADAELRECNFAHQLATFCEVASENWKVLQGVISFNPPPSYGRAAISSWVGSAPTYSDNGQEEYIDAPADNGSGMLGHKLVAGKSASSAGYRSSLVTGGNSSDSLAYGGLIRTVGASLPNGSVWPYGVNSGDEAIDENGSPADIGKFICVCGDWIVHRNSYNGGSTYRGSIPGVFLGKTVTLRANEEPIGQNGRVTRVQLARRIHSTQLDSLAGQRIITLRQEEGGTNLTFSTAKTGAHPSSDYTRQSTIRCAAKHIEDIRRIIRPYIGKSFNTQSLVSIQTAVDKYLQQARVDGYNSGAQAVLSYTRASKILGQLTIKLQMVPPFTIDTITVVTTMAADESELS